MTSGPSRGICSAKAHSSRKSPAQQTTHLLMKDISEPNLQVDPQHLLLLLTIRSPFGTLERPKRRLWLSLITHKEHVPRSSLSAETCLPDARARVENDAVFSAVERMSPCGGVVRRGLDDACVESGVGGGGWLCGSVSRGAWY